MRQKNEHTWFMRVIDSFFTLPLLRYLTTIYIYGNSLFLLEKQCESAHPGTQETLGIPPEVE